MDSAVEDYREFIEYTAETLRQNPDMMKEKIMERGISMKERFEASCQAFIETNSAKRMKMEFPREGKVFAIGDIHADYCTFIMCLKLARVIPDEFNNKYPPETCRWMGGDSIVVQVGDTIGGECKTCDCDYKKRENIYKNECVSFLQIVRLINTLNKQAPNGAGIITLIGNHEMRHILTYNEEITQTSPIRLRKNVTSAFTRNKKCPDELSCPFFRYNEGVWRQEAGIPKALKHSHVNEVIESREVAGISDENDPSGYYSHQRIFQPGGLMSSYLGCASEPILMIGDWIFLHGGVTERFLDNAVFNGIDDDQRKIMFYNMLLKDYILSESKDDYYFLTPGDKQQFFEAMFEEGHEDRTETVSPVWNNKYGVKLTKKCSYLPGVMERLRLNHMVIGHVPQFKKKINTEQLAKPNRHRRYTENVGGETYINACETRGKRVFRTDVAMNYRGCKHRAQIMEISETGDVLYIANRSSNRRDPDNIERYEERIF